MVSKIGGAIYKSGRRITSRSRVSKKWLNATFLSFTGFASRIRSRAVKPAKYENLWVFIRSDAHVVRAGLNIRGCGPLSTPGFFDSREREAYHLPLIFVAAIISVTHQICFLCY